MSKFVTISEELFLDLLDTKFPKDIGNGRNEQYNLIYSKNLDNLHPDTERLDKIANNELAVGWSKFIAQCHKKDSGSYGYHKLPEFGDTSKVEVLSKPDALRKAIDNWSK